LTNYLGKIIVSKRYQLAPHMARVSVFVRKGSNSTVKENSMLLFQTAGRTVPYCLCS
jgi:hypothetical protein